MLEWIDAHGIVMLIGMFLFGNVVSALPKPVNGSQFYKFLYSFLNLTAANAPKIFPSLRVLENQEMKP